MFIKQLNEIIASERDVPWGNGQSRRLLLEEDAMVCGLTDTLVDAGTESLMEYKNHLEACYCIDGEGELECGGAIYPLRPGTLYALDKHDRHILRAKTQLRLICVFYPALKGREKHDFSRGESSCYGAGGDGEAQ